MQAYLAATTFFSSGISTDRLVSVKEGLRSWLKSFILSLPTLFLLLFHLTRQPATAL